MHAIRARYAFDGARFVSDGVTVVLGADRIGSVVGYEAALPLDVEVLEHPGTVMPGLIDCHSHLVADGSVGGLERVERMTDAAIDAVIVSSLEAQAQAGVTTVRDLGDRNFRTLEFRNRPGLPRVVASGPPLTVPDGHCYYLGGVVEGDIGATVAQYAERGVDVIKVMASGGFATPGTDQLGAQFERAELTAIVDQAHDRGLPVVAHAHSLIAIELALEAGVDGIEHFTGLTADGARINGALLDATARRGVYVDLTLGNDRGALHALGNSRPPPLVELMASLGVKTMEEFYATRIALLGRLRNHGVVVVSGVDSGLGPTKRHGNVWRTVPEMVEAGYSVEEALAAVTSVAAEACRLTGETGRLAEGQAADLLLVNGDLAQDVSVLGVPKAVYLRGSPIQLA